MSTLVMTHSMGKMITNNMSMTQEIQRGVGKVLDRTVNQTKKQLTRESAQSTTDRDTSKVVTKTMRVAAPVGTIVSARANSYIVKGSAARVDKLTQNFEKKYGSIADSYNSINPTKTFIKSGNDKLPFIKNSAAIYEMRRNVVSSYIGSFFGKSIDKNNIRNKSSKLLGITIKNSIYSNSYEKAARKVSGTTRKLTRQFSRLLTMPLNGSETTQGIHLVQSAMLPMQVGVSLAVNTSFLVAGNATVLAMKAIKFEKARRSGKSFKDSLKLAKSTVPFGTGKGLRNMASVLIRNKMNNFLLKHTSTESPFFNYYKEKNRIFTETMFNKKTGGYDYKAMKKGLKKSAFKDLKKQLFKDLSKHAFDKFASSKLGKPIVDLTSKMMKKLMLDKIMNFVKGIGEKVTTNFLVQALAKLFNPIKQAFTSLVTFLAPIVNTFVSFVTVALILMFFSLFWDGIAATEKENQAYMIKESDGKAIMKELKQQHDELYKEIIKKALEYDAADIQYPSGSKENYKELFCAIQISLDYDMTAVSNGNLKDFAEALYEQTHIVTEVPYDFEYDDGTVGTACHIYVDIQRNETLAYSVFEGRVPSDVYDDEYVDFCPEGYCDTSNWMDVCQTVKTLIAQTQCGYNQSKWIKIKVNDVIYRVRQDCSGYVSTCLKVYGAPLAGCPATGTLIQQGFLNNYGFTSMAWPGWDNLQQGDILVKGASVNGSWEGGHTEIFYANVNGQHLVYSNGSTNSVNSAYPTNDNRQYVTVHRPINPGEVLESTSGAISAVNGEGSEYIFREWSRSFGENAFILMSNIEDIEIDPATGNEFGYDSGILATIEAAKTYSGYFSPSSYSGVDGAHFVSKNKSYGTASSLDFIRYICAQHGVHADYNNFAMVTNGYTTVDALFSPTVDKTIKRNAGNNDDEDTEVCLQEPYAFVNGNDDLGNLQIGDIMFYVPVDNIWESQYEEDDRDYSKWKGGTSKFTDAIYHSIAMMYVGDGNFVFYGNLVNGHGAASIHTVNASDLDLTRCLNKYIVRYIGFTVTPVYGSTASFAGWTDNKIGELIVLINGSQWVDKTLHLPAPGISDEVDKAWNAEPDEQDKKEWEEAFKDAEPGDFVLNPYDAKDISYAWYDEDICPADIYAADLYETGEYIGYIGTSKVKNHINTLENELARVSICYYDQFGILPSIAYTHMAVVSHYRSTEESLKYYNLFELESGGTGSESVTKYDYTSDGDSSGVVRSYKKYFSYLEAYSDWSEYAKSKGYDIKINFAETFYEQKDKYILYSLVTPKDAEKMRAIYVKTSSLLSYDQEAIERKKAIDDVVIATDQLVNSALTTESPSKYDYYTHCELMSNLTAEVRDLNKVLAKRGTATERTDKVFNDALDAWCTAESIRQAAYAYYSDPYHKAEEYVESWYCGTHYYEDITKVDVFVELILPDPITGNLSTVIDPETGEPIGEWVEVENKVSGYKTCDVYCPPSAGSTAIKNCCNTANITLENWAVYGNQGSLTEPVYDQIFEQE